MSLLRVGGQNCSRAGKSVLGVGSDLSKGAGVGEDGQGSRSAGGSGDRESKNRLRHCLLFL